MQNKNCCDLPGWQTQYLLQKSQVDISPVRVYVRLQRSLCVYNMICNNLALSVNRDVREIVCTRRKEIVLEIKWITKSQRRIGLEVGIRIIIGIGILTVLKSLLSFCQT